MKDLFGKFVISDILGHFLLGVLLLAGIISIFILYYPTYSDDVIKQSNNWLVGFIFLVMSYVIGQINAEISGFIEGIIEKPCSKENQDDTFAPRKIHGGKVVEAEIDKALKDIFENAEVYTENNLRYYLVRSLIMLHCPQIYQVANRENSIRQFRRNAIIPVILWTVVLGIYIATHSFFKNSNLTLIVILFLSLCFLLFISVRSLINSKKRAEKHDVRETYTGFLAAYYTGLIENRKKAQASLSVSG